MLQERRVVVFLPLFLWLWHCGRDTTTLLLAVTYKNCSPRSVDLAKRPITQQEQQQSFSKNFANKFFKCFLFTSRLSRFQIRLSSEGPDPALFFRRSSATLNWNATGSWMANIGVTASGSFRYATVVMMVVLTSGLPESCQRISVSSQWTDSLGVFILKAVQNVCRNLDGYWFLSIFICFRLVTCEKWFVVSLRVPSLVANSLAK